ncbi:MAG: hypothetical protein ACLFR0_00350 [Alphaproteobacteria bacterium]
MAGPLAGIGQQIPLSTPFQPGGSENSGQQVRQRDSQNNQPQKVNQVQPESANVNSSQQTNVIEQQLAEARDPTSEEGRRGSLVDIQV